MSSFKQPALQAPSVRWMEDAAVLSTACVGATLVRPAFSPTEGDPPVASDARNPLPRAPSPPRREIGRLGDQVQSPVSLGKRQDNSYLTA
jgi:hypothetical protein